MKIDVRIRRPPVYFCLFVGFCSCFSVKAFFLKQASPKASSQQELIEMFWHLFTLKFERDYSFSKVSVHSIRVRINKIKMCLFFSYLNKFNLDLLVYLRNTEAAFRIFHYLCDSLF
jgi:hypothetical protein